MLTAEDARNIIKNREEEYFVPFQKTIDDEVERISNLISENSNRRLYELKLTYYNNSDLDIFVKDEKVLFRLIDVIDKYGYDTEARRTGTKIENEYGKSHITILGIELNISWKE